MPDTEPISEQSIQTPTEASKGFMKKLEQKVEGFVTFGAGTMAVASGLSDIMNEQSLKMGIFKVILGAFGEGMGMKIAFPSLGQKADQLNEPQVSPRPDDKQ